MLPEIMVRKIAFLAPSDEPFESRNFLWAGPGSEPVAMPRPDVLLLEGDDTGHAMLYRYSAGGVFCGDTWHESVSAAEDAAAEEYGQSNVGPWSPVPEAKPDAHGYAIERAAMRAGNS